MTKQTQVYNNVIRSRLGCLVFWHSKFLPVFPCWVKSRDRFCLVLVIIDLGECVWLAHIFSLCVVVTMPIRFGFLLLCKVAYNRLAVQISEMVTSMSVDRTFLVTSILSLAWKNTWCKLFCNMGISNVITELGTIKTSLEISQPQLIEHFCWCFALAAC